jgi:CheY-like chemotaxis protein
VSLPVLSAARAPVSNAHSTAFAAAGTRPKVLVVDDNRDAADSLQALFEMENCEVATAYDGCEAVLATEHGMPDMIVMDLGMPKMDGYEAARRIREKPGSHEVLMIALTGWGQSDARQRTLEAGFDHHMIKPVDFDEIRRLASERLPGCAPLRQVG